MTDARSELHRLFKETFSRKDKMKSNMRSRIAGSLVLIVILCGSRTLQGKQNSQGVIVENTAANPVPVNVQHQVTTKDADNPAFQPFAKYVADVPAFPGPNDTVTFDVPAGKRLVIELVTINGTLSSGNTLAVVIIKTLQPDGSTVTHHLTIPPLGKDINGRPTYCLTHPLRLYAEPGVGSVSIFVARDGDGSTFSVGASISGYLVDIP